MKDHEMMEIKLNKNEWTYLSQKRLLSNKMTVDSRKDKNDIFILELSENQADEIRDKCGERLQHVGFNEKYELNKEGKLLECLIDKFFIG